MSSARSPQAGDELRVVVVEGMESELAPLPGFHGADGNAFAEAALANVVTTSHVWLFRLE